MTWCAPQVMLRSDQVCLFANTGMSTNAQTSPAELNVFRFIEKQTKVHASMNSRSPIDTKRRRQKRDHSQGHTYSINTHAACTHNFSYPEV